MERAYFKGSGNMGYKSEDYKEGERYCREWQLRISESETRRYLSPWRPHNLLQVNVYREQQPW